MSHMSESGSCDDDHSRDPPLSRAARSADDIPRHEKPLTLTSRCSLKHAYEVMQGFSDYKRWLVSEIGWGGMLDVPYLQKLNLKFSAWIMSRVDVQSRSIVLTETKILRFWSEDVHKVFGVPCGPRNVMGRDANIRPDAIDFIKNTLGMNQAGAHSLKAAEAFLMREITDDSSKIEKDCFQIAFVIFVMGHILAPSTKYDYATIDFWGALGNTELISQFNWCEYIMHSLLDAVDKYNRDVKNKVQSANLFGCHFWLQIFLLDNLDLGIFNKKHDILPRMKEFDAEWIRKLIIMASDIGKKPQSYSSKRPPLAPGSVNSIKRNKGIAVAADATSIPDAARRIKEHSLRMYTQTEASYGSDNLDSNSLPVFGQISTNLPKRRSIFSGSYASNPWKSGLIPPSPQLTVAQDLQSFFRRSSNQELERFWLVHNTPRLICVTGTALQQQLAGDNFLEHELSCALLRRINQMDFELNQDCPYLNWRHIMETDFATIVLAGKDFLHSISIQNQFLGGHIRYSIVCCQYFFVPAILDDGYVLYMWDMPAPDILVLDPLAGAQGPTSDRKECHNWVSERLHDALF